MTFNGLANLTTQLDLSDFEFVKANVCHFVVGLKETREAVCRHRSMVCMAAT